MSLNSEFTASTDRAGSMIQHLTVQMGVSACVCSGLHVYVHVCPLGLLTTLPGTHRLLSNQYELTSVFTYLKKPFCTFR